jgi:two-component system, OmpR family, phosphate regulon sensor histidine kinase PhoR
VSLRRLRTRMVVTAVTASAAALAAVLILVGPALRARALAREREMLLAEARLMARVVEEYLARTGTLAGLDPVVDATAGEVRERVTIVDLDGRVVADSSVSGAELAALENHGQRPEVLAALAEGAGSSVRHSATLGVDLMYAAVPVRVDGRPRAVSRVAHSLAEIGEQVAALRRSVGLALLLAFVITVPLATLLSNSLVGPLREIMQAARQFGAGDLTSRIRVERQDELGELGRILNHAAEQLQERLGELGRDRARTEAILSAMEEGVLAVDHKGLVLVANDALRRHFDLSEPLGRHYLEVVRQSEVSAIIEGVLQDAERRTGEIEVPHLHLVFTVTGVSFPVADGLPPGAILTFHNTTERRRLERVRRDFVANASHELRTPLTSIRGFVEALEDGATADTALATRFLGKIHTQADRMALLADDLLELSRLESEERAPTWTNVRPAAVAAEVAASLGALASERHIELMQHDDGSPEVVSDAEYLRRIIENIVDNALKYTQEGGHVEVLATSGTDGGAVVEVRDDGPGIAAEHLPRIFERFYRVDKARSRELGGTGLGLAIVKHLAESIGAEVTVTSEPGRGSQFRVRLPQRPQSDKSRGAPTPA